MKILTSHICKRDFCYQPNKHSFLKNINWFLMAKQLHNLYSSVHQKRFGEKWLSRQLYKNPIPRSIKIPFIGRSVGNAAVKMKFLSFIRLPDIYFLTRFFWIMSIKFNGSHFTLDVNNDIISDFVFLITSARKSFL